MEILAILSVVTSCVIAADRYNIATSASGAPIEDLTESLTVGPRGPLLLQDIAFLEELSHLARERIPERVVHPQGVGAFGYFEVTGDIRPYCKAKVFGQMEKKTPVFVRLSTASVGKDSPDTIRDTRGFATKLYTEDGNWDLLSINSPVHFVGDPMLFPDFAHCGKRHPVTNLKDPNIFWDIVTLRPESVHNLIYLYSDAAIPDGYRHMNTFGVNTYKLVNAEGTAVYCKFHLRTNQGVKNLLPERAEALQVEDPDYFTRDLFDAIQNGDYPSWTLYIQVMTFQQAETWYFNPFDITKIWPEVEFPLIKVGRLVLNRNPQNYFAQVEQAAFSPANMVPGIEPSPDKFLQARLFTYSDTQRYRLGTNFKQIPINCPLKPPRNYERDGAQTVTNNQGGAPNYYPNSFEGPVPDPSSKQSCFRSSGDICRYNSSNEDKFTQPGILYREVLGEAERTRLIDNQVKEISQTLDFIQKRAAKNFYQVDANYGRRIEEGLQKLKDKK